MVWTRTNVSRSYNTTGAQTTEPVILGNSVYQFIQVGAGAVQLTVELSNDNASWETLGTIALSAPGDKSFLTSVNSWRWFRVNISVLTATSVNLELSGG